MTLSILKAFDITRTPTTLKLFSAEFQTQEVFPTASSGWKCRTECTTPFAHLLTHLPQPLALPVSVLTQISKLPPFSPLPSLSLHQQIPQAITFEYLWNLRSFPYPKPGPRHYQSSLGFISSRASSLLYPAPCFPPHSSQRDPSRQQTTSCISSA